MSEATPGLYVHVPFCAVKCAYCDFAAFSGHNHRAERYLAALGKELDAFAGTAVRTLYIGGGTPTELSAGQLRRLLWTVEDRFGPVAALDETTCEANPETTDRERLDVLRAGGVTRLSLGLQAKQDRLLKTLNRQHDFARFERAFEDARAAGFDNINVDLMFGLPGQSEADLLDSIDAAAALGPEHVSVYALQIEDKTGFKKRGVENDEDLEGDMYALLRRELGARGYEHYEISNFAKPGKRSVHNQIYWNREPCLAAGCGASGFWHGTRWTNHWKLDAYLEAIESAGTAWESSERLQGREALGEALYLGLRMLGGVKLTPSRREAFKGSLERLKSEGLLEHDEERLRLTEKGLFLSNRVFREFV